MSAPKGNVYTQKHGHFKNNKPSPTYKSWQSMIYRCTNPKARGYRRYGGRGIKVCAEWRIFSNFLKDMNERPNIEYSIDRIDANGDYCKSNCQWILKSDNSKKVLRKSCRSETNLTSF